MEYFLDDQSSMVRNHFYFGVDPDGNQLPYVDGIINFKMESVDVAILRAMQGESDLDADTLSRQMSGIPLFITNMERGDYSIYHWPDLSGGDHSLFFNQTWNEDKELGRWLRTTGLPESAVSWPSIVMLSTTSSSQEWGMPRTMSSTRPRPTTRASASRR